MRNYYALSLTEAWKKVAASASGSSVRNLMATECIADSGQSWNQSMKQQLTRLGNIRSLFLKVSPIGEKVKITCM
jgi:hypothetical protein